jgi:lysosomal Pro-X carboxypeptidase
MMTALVGALLTSSHRPHSFSRGIGPLASMTSYVPEPALGAGGAPQPGTPNCSVHWFEQTIDHFSWRPTPTGARTFRQRYFVNTQYWSGAANAGPILFYTGNEANVELYVNATGLMWENAAQLGAALVFAEHRYYGETMPFGGTQAANMVGEKIHYLTMEQALADFATLVAALKRQWGAQRSAVVAFGGSYGGMLASWLRMKYPGTVDGAIAGSAPILAFAPSPGLPTVARPFGDGERYWQVVTADATAKGGAAPACAANVRAGWDALFALGRTGAPGRATLTAAFGLCQPLRSDADVTNLALMHLNAWDTMAMGNFPYPSNYLVFQQTQDPSLKLPAFPVRAACEHLKGNFTGGGGGGDDGGVALLEAMRDAGGVFYNVSGVPCYELPDDPNFDGIWDYQYCTELLPQETYFTRDGVHDMFWPVAEDFAAIDAHCNATLGVMPRNDWIGTEFGGTAGASNIVFSNGAYDPWSSGGVTTDVSDTAVAVVIAEGAHHLDLMFSNAADPESVKAARRLEVEHINRWIDEKKLAEAAKAGAREL